MQQIAPVFGSVIDRRAIADALDLEASELESELPIQMVSTGLHFVIVPIKHLRNLQLLQPNLGKADAYIKEHQIGASGSYFITRDTGDTNISLRARAIFLKGQDPATGAAAGCASVWTVKCRVARPEESEVILQGVEIKRPSKLFVKPSKGGSDALNTRVGGMPYQ